MEGREQLVEMFQAVLRTSQELERSYNELKVKFNILESKLERSRKYLENILESINTGVCSVDLDGKITVFNREAIRVFESNNMVGRDVFEVFGFSGVSVRWLIEEFKEQKVYEVDVAGKRKKLNLSVSSIDEDGHTIGCVIIFSDITRLEELKEENRRKEKLAIMGQMAATIAHEIKNPLASMELLVPILARSGDGSEKEEILNNIMVSIKRIDNIVNNTLLFTKTMICKPSEIEVEGFFAELESEIYATLNKRGIKFDKVVGVSKLTADKNLLRSALINLLVNAVEAARSRVSLSIRLDKDGSIVFEVEDDGYGIPEDVTEHIFEPFYTSKKGGTGLGLSIVKQAVERMRGSVGFETSSSGTKFMVRI